MTLLSDILDVNLLAQHLLEKRVSVQGDEHGYRIFNYTAKAQYDKAWDDVTLQCRGLIVAPDQTVAARPFRKFFNLGEMIQIPDGSFMAYEKMDGSLGIAYFNAKGQVRIATRGSFQSDQAIWATEWLNGQQDLLAQVAYQLKEGRTPLFEIIYPENRIVVDYNGREDLVLLSSVDIATGVDDPEAEWWDGSVTTRYGGLEIDKIQAMNEPNSEGFVLRWNDGTRAKVKFPEYVRLHRLVTGVTARSIWDLLCNRIKIEPLLEMVPDEFYNWVKATVADLNGQFSAIEKEAFRVLSLVPRDAARKEQAALITQSKYPSIVFLMLDDRPYAESIWKMIRPEATKPFKVEE